MKKFFSIVCLLCLTVVSAFAGTTFEPDVEYTSLGDLEGKTFAIVNKADGKALFGSNAQNLGYDVYATAFQATNSGYVWKAELDAASGAYYLQLVTPAGADYNCWGMGGVLNSQGEAQGWACSFILGGKGSDQKGQDIQNGALWKLEYTAEGWTLKNVGTDMYQGHNTKPANSTEAAYWTFCSLKEVDDGIVPETFEMPASLKPFIENGTQFYLKSGDQYLIGGDQQAVAMGSWADVEACTNSTMWVLTENEDGSGMFRAVTADGSNVSAWGANPCFLNAQPAVGGVLFKMNKDQDIKNGSSWILAEVEGGYTLQCVANKGYATTAVNTSAEPVVWQLYLPEPAVGGWDGTITTSLDDVVLKSADDVDGITLTFNGAKSIELSEEANLTVADTWGYGNEVYYMWAPAYNDIFGTNCGYTIDGDKITLTGIFDVMKFMSGGGIEPYAEKLMAAKKAARKAPVQEGDTEFQLNLYGGGFIIDGDTENIPEIDLFLNVEEPAAPELVLSNLDVQDYISMGGPLMVMGRTAEGDNVTLGFDAEGNFLADYSGMDAADYSHSYTVKSGTGSIKTNEDGSKTIDVTATMSNDKTYHITATIEAPAAAPFELPEVAATTEGITLTFDVAAATEGKENPTLEGQVAVTKDGVEYRGGFSETDVVDGKVTVTIPANNIFCYAIFSSLTLEAGDEIEVTFPELSLYENFTAGGYDTTWEGAMEGSVKVTVAGAAAPELANADFAEGAVGDVNIATYAKDGEVNQMQEVPGWSFGVENGDARAAGVVAYGSAATLGGAAYGVPAAGPEGTNGNALAMVGVWTGTVQYVQNVTLPAGKYTMTVPVYNTTGTTAFVKNLIGVTYGETENFATTTNYATGKWIDETVVFELAEETEVTVSLGYVGENCGSGNAQHLFLDCVKIEPYDELAVAKTNAIAALPVAGEGIFANSAEEVEAAKAAIEAATTVEEVEAVVLPDVQALVGEYTIKNANGDFYLGEAKLSAAPVNVTFEKAEGGYYIKVGEVYVNMAGNNNWSMNATETATTAWNFNFADGQYTIQGPKGMIGTDALEDGAATYGDKNASKNGLWIIEEAVAPIEITPALILGEEEIALFNGRDASVEMAEAIKVDFVNGAAVRSGAYYISEVGYDEEGEPYADVITGGELSINGNGYAEFEELVKFEQGKQYQLNINVYGATESAEGDDNFSVPTPIATFSCMINGAYVAPIEITPALINGEEEIALFNGRDASVVMAEAIKVDFVNGAAVRSGAYYISEVGYDEEGERYADVITGGELSINGNGYAEFEEAVKFEQGKQYQLDINVYGATESAEGDDNFSVPTPIATFSCLINGAYATLEAGQYYIMENESGLFLSNGANWGTRSVLFGNGICYNVELGEDGKYTLKSGIKNANTALRPSDGFNDQSGAWELIPTVGGYYMFNGEKYFTREEGNAAPQYTDNKADASVWSFVTEAERKAALAEATSENPVDATVYIKAPDFHNADVANAAWSKTKIGGEGGSGSTLANSHNCEQWNAGEFTIDQTITDLPNGFYKVSCQGFTRKNGASVESADSYEAGEILPAYLFANDNKVALKSIFAEADKESKNGWSTITATSGEVYVIANGQNTAADIFTRGAYVNEVMVEVTDGTLNLGVMSEGGIEWVVFDSFRLTYYGEEYVEPIVITPALIMGEEEITLNDHSAVSVEEAEALKVTFENGAAVQTAMYEICEAVEDPEEGLVYGDLVADGLLSINGFGYAEFENAIQFEQGKRYYVRIMAFGAQEEPSEEPGQIIAPTPIATYECLINGAYVAPIVVIPALIDGEEEITLNDHMAVSVEKADALKVTFENGAAIQTAMYEICEAVEDPEEGLVYGDLVADGLLSMNTVGYAEFENTIQFAQGKRYFVRIMAFGEVPANDEPGQIIAPTPIATYECLINGAYAEPEVADCDLTRDLFHEWDSYGANGNIVGDGGCDFQMGVSTGMPYGNGSVIGSQYADLSAWEVLALTVTEGAPRLLLNRQDMGGSSPDFLEINNPDSPYVIGVKDGVWYINLAKIVEEKGYAHLNVIKGANWANVTITEAKLIVDGSEIITGISEVETANAKDGKFLKNGKIVIVKNGKTFSTTGARMK